MPRKNCKLVYEDSNSVTRTQEAGVTHTPETGGDSGGRFTICVAPQLGTRYKTVGKNADRGGLSNWGRSAIVEFCREHLMDRPEELNMENDLAS